MKRPWFEIAAMTIILVLGGVIRVFRAGSIQMRVGRHHFRSYAVVLAVLLALSGQESMCQTTNSVDDDLRHSELCARAALNFRSQPEWKDEPATFTSHFNKKLGKCLVKVVSSNIVARNEILETQHVYDAMEGTVLGGQLLNKELAHDGEEKILGITMVRVGKILGRKNPEEAAEAYEWFQTLMKD